MKKVLFVCEGPTEVYLLYKILKRYSGLNENKRLLISGNLSMKKLDEEVINLFFSDKSIEVYVSNMEGETNLGSYTINLAESRMASEIDKVLYIMDADFKQGNETGFERTKKSLEENKILLQGKLKDENSEINYFIMPNNKDEGMTETLILKSLKCQEIVNYMDKVISDVKKMPESEIKNETKSKFIMVAATQAPLKPFAQFFISSCFDKINQENEEFQKIKKFILDNIKIDI